MELPVSLFDPVLIDHPLVTDAPDVLQVYSSLFAGLPE
ncbi:Transposase [Pseudomonas syringae pv. maculicola]|nr:Transposase [Pseudomonas syringae pv. maculicola]